MTTPNDTSLQSTRNDVSSSRARFRSFPSGVTALVAFISLAEWVYLGLATPGMKLIYADFASDFATFDWPHRYVMGLHWVWCIPAGILLATGFILKDRRCSPVVVRVTNLAVLIAGMALLVLWVWGTVPHRMSQRAQIEWENKGPSVESGIRSSLCVVRVPLAVPDQRI